MKHLIEHFKITGGKTHNGKERLFNKTVTGKIYKYKDVFFAITVMNDDISRATDLETGAKITEMFKQLTIDEVKKLIDNGNYQKGVESYKNKFSGKFKFPVNDATKIKNFKEIIL